MALSSFFSPSRLIYSGLIKSFEKRFKSIFPARWFIALRKSRFEVLMNKFNGWLSFEDSIGSRKKTMRYWNERKITFSKNEKPSASQMAKHKTMEVKNKITKSDSKNKAKTSSISYGCPRGILSKTTFDCAFKIKALSEWFSHDLLSI